jgi:hypothetical protein
MSVEENKAKVRVRFFCNDSMYHEPGSVGSRGRGELREMMNINERLYLTFTAAERCTMKAFWIILSLVFIMLVACREPHQETATQEIQEMAADEKSNPYIEQGNEAMQMLQSGLVKTLTNEIREGGVGSAIFVCRDEAPKIAAGVTEETKIAVGRTSHRLRNPRNIPPAWAEAIVRQSAGGKMRAAESHVFDLGDTIAILKPINTMGLCTNCHGNTAEMDGEVKRALAKAYPNDQAVGFSVGDLRGWMWAEVTK